MPAPLASRLFLVEEPGAAGEVRIPLDKQTEAIWGKYKLKGSKVEIAASQQAVAWGHIVSDY